MNQHDFIRLCLTKYETTPLPEGEVWEEAHYPVPSCKGGTEVVLLWSRDHSFQGVLQSEEYSYPCLHGFRKLLDEENLRQHYPDCLPLFYKWYKKLQSLGGQAAGSVTGRLNKGLLHCNNGVVSKKYRVEDGLPEGFTPGRLRTWKTGFAWCNNGEVNKHYDPDRGLPYGFTSGRLGVGSWCNNGIVEKQYEPSRGLPEGFLSGRLKRSQREGKPHLN
jgi:hypothetical protein